APWLHAKAVAVGIQLRSAGYDHLMRSKTPQERQIALERARISLEILRIVKLRWVHENTDDDNLIFTTAAFDERRMSAVKSAHSGNESNSAAAEGSTAVQPLRQRVPHLRHE